MLPFSQEGASHFADVRVLFLLDIRLLAVSLAALLALYLLRRRKGMALCRFGGRGPGFWAACGLGGLFVIVGGLAALDFDRAHQLVKTLFLLKKITTPWRGLLLGKHRIYRSLGCQSVPSKIMSSRSPFMKMLVMVSRSFLLFSHL